MKNLKRRDAETQRRTKGVPCIVVNEYLGCVRELVRRSTPVWRNVPPGGVLLNGGRVATVFPNRAAAQAAIARTLAWFETIDRHPGHEAGQQIDELFSIIRLSSASSASPRLCV